MLVVIFLFWSDCCYLLYCCFFFVCLEATSLFFCIRALCYYINLASLFGIVMHSGIGHGVFFFGFLFYLHFLHSFFELELNSCMFIEFGVSVYWCMNIYYGNENYEK